MSAPTHRPTHISCHVLDTALGRPASGVLAVLSQLAGGVESLSLQHDPDSDKESQTEPQWRVVDRQRTDADGRAKFDLPAAARSPSGTGAGVSTGADTGSGGAHIGSVDNDARGDVEATVYRVTFYTAAHHAAARCAAASAPAATPASATASAAAASAATPPTTSSEASRAAGSGGRAAFFPRIDIQIDTAAVPPAIDPSTGGVVHKFHIPLLLSPFGYSTYRGS